jgi:hypothetical protein
MARESPQPGVDLTFDPDTTNMKLVARWSELVPRERSPQRATRLILVVSGARVAAGVFDKSTGDPGRMARVVGERAGLPANQASI